MKGELGILALAASLGFLHTIGGPDHYLPFIAMSRARGWSVFKTGWITLLCGLGHVGSSAVIGGIGLSVGFGISMLHWIEGLRGNLAAWLLVLFGTAYGLWGYFRARGGRSHRHIHVHPGGVVHEHTHSHTEDPDHVHPAGSGSDHPHSHPEVHEQVRSRNITPWVLFTIFVLGPCESLIPLMMYPAASKSTAGIVEVVLVFSLVTILTMITVVVLASYGLRFVRLGGLDKYMHALAGGMILLCGLAILLLGL